MSTNEVRSSDAARNAGVARIEMKLEVVVIPVSDVDRAKSFYSSLGWRLDGDFAVGRGYRNVQFTPPGSSCSIHFGTGVTAAVPGSAQVLYLVVSDIEAARAELTARGVSVSEVLHREGPGPAHLSGPHPQRGSYASFASFTDPDGNRWLLQEVTVRLPGRVDPEDTNFTSPPELAAALRRAAAAHGQHERRMARGMQSGRTGMQPTWWRSMPVSLYQHERLRLGVGSTGKHCAAALVAGGLRIETLKS
jgi:catechol 2,3-dioxygenase-like lactoylglutathione lyase family enzyme